MSPLRKRWIAGLSAVALVAAAGFALAQDQAPSGLQPGDLPAASDNASAPDDSAGNDNGLAPAAGDDGGAAPGNSEDQGGALPPMRGSTADEQPMDIGITPPEQSGDETGGQTPPPDAANPDIGLSPDTAPGDVLAPPGEAPPPQPAETTHQPLPRAPAEPGGAVAVLRGLDKISARVTVVDAPIGKPVMFGRLKIIADYCHKQPPELPPEVTAFLRIDDTRITDPTKSRIFSGWMYASTPALHAVEHPVYDVWLVDCKSSTPESDFGKLPSTPTPKQRSTTKASPTGTVNQ